MALCHNAAHSMAARKLTTRIDASARKVFQLPSCLPRPALYNGKVATADFKSIPQSFHMHEYFLAFSMSGPARQTSATDAQLLIGQLQVVVCGHESHRTRHRRCDACVQVRSSKQDQIHNSIVSTLLALMDGLDSRGSVVVIGALPPVGLFLPPSD